MPNSQTKGFSLGGAAKTVASALVAVVAGTLAGAAATAIGAPFLAMVIAEGAAHLAAHVATEKALEGKTSERAPAEWITQNMMTPKEKITSDNAIAPAA